jgi:DNA (cytosine-5)-methyltransferase 1
MQGNMLDPEGDSCSYEYMKANGNRTRTQRGSLATGNNRRKSAFSVVDLFSGAGGMSYGFHRHPSFRLVAAADAEIAKPSMGRGSLRCNSTYEKNIGIAPKNLDLSSVSPEELRTALEIGERKIDVLCVCPPCTGFSRTNPLNHVRDDHRNSLVGRAAEFATALEADIVVMENARELIRGNFKGHFGAFKEHLESRGYRVAGKSHMLSGFGLPQIRERAIVVAARDPIDLRTLDSLWDGWEVAPEALTVRAAFAAIDPEATARDAYPSFATRQVADRLAAIPADGGSWVDLLSSPATEHLLTDSMKRIVRLGKLGSHPDVYGRMAWDRPAPTIKRECAHIGNGRYAHPEENRLCSVREMAILQGFPNEFVFNGNALSNNYRHIGDAVPPLISHQLAWVCSWMLTGRKPRVHRTILSGTHLRPEHIQPASEKLLLDVA